MNAPLPERARDFARHALSGQTDKAYAPLTAHAERMAERFEDPTARAVAYLHDVIEDSDTPLEDLSNRFPREVVDAVVVLTRLDGERYSDYIARVAQAGGIALAVKRADVDDHLAHREHIPESLIQRYERAREAMGNANPDNQPMMRA